ncbi:MAG: hypothetical protein KAX49_06005 [Halanaerobiales bacterium]|nr:hypothetical protein [Halanaerobiales bacterium]
MMREMMQEVLLTGVGAALWTKDMIEERVRGLMNQGMIGRVEGENLMNQMIHRADVERERMKLRVTEEIQKGLKSSGIITKSDFEELKDEIKSLKSQVFILESKLGYETTPDQQQ